MSGVAQVLSKRAMKPKMLLSALGCALLSVGVGCSGNDNSVDLTRQLIAAMTAENKVDGWPRLGPLETWDLEVDTYTHEVSSSVIASLYASACKKLAELYGKEVHTYTWSDLESWPRIATVVQFQNEGRGPSYLVVRAYQNNDNDSFSFQYCSGTFNTDKKQLQPSWTLPKNHLRSDDSNQKKSK